MNYIFIDCLIYLKNLLRRPFFSQIYLNSIKNKVSLEIGGPSSIFKGFLPLYIAARRVDNVVFSSNTVWYTASFSQYRYFLNLSGRSYINEATNLEHIESDSYEAVISSNVLEHIANPIKALNEMNRVLSDDGILILVVPNKIGNFDRYRSVTKLEHIIDDFNRSISEYDLTHLNEIIALHDLSLDKAAGNEQNFKARSLNNFYNRTLHHHVFSSELIRDIVTLSGFKVIRCDTTLQNFFVLARKN